MKIFRYSFLSLLFFNTVLASPSDIFNAIVRGNEELVVRLVNEKNINDLLDFEGKQVTPFYLACLLNQTFIGEALVQFGPDTKFKCAERFGRQAIHEAAYSNAKTHILLLLAMGANPESSTQNGETPLNIAYKYGHKNIICILEKVLQYKPENYQDPKACLQLIENCIKAGELSLPIEIINEVLRTESPLRFSFLKLIYLLSEKNEVQLNEAVLQIKESLLATPLQKRRVLSVVSKEFIKLENRKSCLTALWWIKAYLQKNWDKFMQNVNLKKSSSEQKKLYEELLEKKSEFVLQIDSKCANQ